MHYEKVTYRDTDITIGYTEEGCYYPATHEQPEEYPDITIEEVYMEDLNIYNILIEDQLTKIQELLIDKIQ